MFNLLLITTTQHNVQFVTTPQALMFVPFLISQVPQIPIFQQPLTGGESGSVNWEWGHYTSISPPPKERKKMDSTAEATAFPVFGPSRGTPARPRGGASPEGGRVGSRCMQRHCRWRRCCRLRCCRIRDSVAVSCIAACCASLPAEHCRPAAAHCSCASFVLCHHAASIVPAAAAVTHSLLEVRLLGKLG